MSKSLTTEQKEERLAALKEAAGRLGVSVWTLRAWVQAGKIASNKLGGRRLIPVSEIERLIAATRVPARITENENARKPDLNLAATV